MSTDHVSAHQTQRKVFLNALRYSVLLLTFMSHNWGFCAKIASTSTTTAPFHCSGDVNSTAVSRYSPARLAGSPGQSAERPFPPPPASPCAVRGRQGGGAEIKKAPEFKLTIMSGDWRAEQIFSRHRDNQPGTDAIPRLQKCCVRPCPCCWRHDGTCCCLRARFLSLCRQT